MWRRRIVAGLVLLGILPVLGMGPSGASEQHLSVGILRYEGDFEEMQDPSKYGFVILNAWEHRYIAGLKAANPNLEVLLYKDMAACEYWTGSDPDGRTFHSVGVGCQQAEQEYPEWFLTDTSGERVEWCDYPGNWYMDVGAPSYQDVWTENVLGELEEFGWDGVLVDDALYSPRHHLCGRVLSRHPDDATFGAATESFLARVGPALTSRGFLAIPNVSDTDVPTFGRWLGYTSGAMKEWWVADSLRVRSGDDWEYGQRFLQEASARGKLFLGVTYGSIENRALMAYARASFLLDWNGRNGALLYHAGRHVDPWSPEWTAEVGEPVGDRYRVGKAWRRDFTGGTVIVNPSANSSVTLELEGRYQTPRGSTLRSVSLEPMSGTILSSGGQISLRAKKHRKPRAFKVTLRWSGARSQKVAIERNGKVLTRTPNDRRYRDIVRMKGQRFRYRVCEVGSSRCSRKIRTKV
jgi:hypothetical protein